MTDNPPHGKLAAGAVKAAWQRPSESSTARLLKPRREVGQHRYLARTGDCSPPRPPIRYTTGPAHTTPS
jgi:hypothetical protein